MVTLDAETTREDGTTFVRVRVAGAAVPHRVRIDSCLDGPVWPPRSRGIPEPGWDDDGFGGVVPADAVLALGFASPAEPVDPPVALRESEPVTGHAGGSTAAGGREDAPGRARLLPRESGGATDSSGATRAAEADGSPSATAADGSPTAAAVLRSLGDPVPPRDAVPPGGGDRDTGDPDRTPAVGTDGTSGAPGAVADGDGRRRSPVDPDQLATVAERARSVAERAGTLAERARRVERARPAESADGSSLRRDGPPA